MAESKDAERRERRPARLWDWFDSPDLSRWFGSIRPMFGDESRLRVEEELTDDGLIVRVEAPGIDPERDAEITVEGRMLHVRVERRHEAEEEHEGRVRSEFHYGTLRRSLSLPEGVKGDDVTATYKDGVLEIRVPVPEAPSTGSTKVRVARR